MHGIILAAGEGKRLRPITFSLPKPLIPLLGKPLLAYGIEQLKRLGINEVSLVVGWLGFAFKERLGNEFLGVKIDYVTQEERLGIAHAISLVIKERDLKEDFIVYLGDNIIDEEWVPKFKKLIEKEDYDSVIFLAKVPDPRRFGVAIIKDGKIVGFVEKPKEPPSQYALIGLYYFRDPEEYMKCFSTLKPSARGEYEITDIINCYIKNNKKIGFVTIERWWKDAGKPKDLIEAMIILMDMYLKEPKILGEVKGEVIGNVYVEKGAIIEGKVYGPAYIGEGVVVGPDSVIEHYVDLERGSRVQGGSISRSLILDEASLNLGVSRMIDSIIGMKSQVYVDPSLRTIIKMMAAQESSLELK
ncbi:glucose-1-phosphate thymidylyltransferase [Ignicoccus pacificus DSM 13166]|uniref:Glucose-1-phosphate thymidylyltransferase n=1 Tax=Ignicoccus pacificus DSM 13166 TaxID=940294 RepID=A0A977KBH1_9CREN|nr:glucose-1-phosphate thymidylyltransferase [Ignicoccus pacificus DSM 13166]